MLKETIETTYLHFNRAKDNYEEILNYQLDIEIYENREKIKTIDAFIFRFIKLQDFMGDKLFKELLKKIGEYKDNMALIDVLDKLEKLEVIDRADRWLDFRFIRNKLTHEYPDNEEDVIEGIKLALLYFVEIETVLQNIMKYIQNKKLLAL